MGTGTRKPLDRALGKGNEGSLRIGSDEEFAEAAGATKADLESQPPHAHDHAKPTEKDGKLE